MITEQHREQTNFEKRQQKATQYQSRKRRGLCTTCSKPAGLNLDGTRSVSCDEHKRQHGSGNLGVDFIENPGYLDTPAFKAFCILLVKVIGKIGRASIGDLRRALGSDFNERWIHDALNVLVAARLLRRVSHVAPSRWEVHNA